MNKLFTIYIPTWYGETHQLTLASAKDPIVTKIPDVTAIWAVEAALLVGILTCVAFAWRPVVSRFADGSKAAIAGALLAAMNTASEYGVLRDRPGMTQLQHAVRHHRAST
jgi:H+/gluconate symporter-like permease